MPFALSGAANSLAERASLERLIWHLEKCRPTLRESADLATAADTKGRATGRLELIKSPAIETGRVVQHNPEASGRPK